MGVTVTVTILTLEDNAETPLTSQVVDQAELHGWLRNVRDLALSLLSVMQAEPKPANGPGWQRGH